MVAKKKARAKPPAKVKAKPPAKKPAPKRKPKRESKKARIARERTEKLAAGKAAAADHTAAKQGPAEHLAPHQWKPGQSGNPKGRPKGARSKLAEGFIQDLQNFWQVHGAMAIEEAFKESPIGIVRTIAGVIPQEVEHRVSDFEDVSDEDLQAGIARTIAALGGTLAGVAAAAGRAAQGAATED